jgi:predicted metal-binding membrane protein
VAARGRDQFLVWGAVGGVTLAAWGYLAHMAAMPDMAGGLGPWTGADVLFAFVMWVVMMVGMMLPSAAPVILLVAAISRRRAAAGGPGLTAAFGLGYVLAWGGFSVVATAAQWGLHTAALLSPRLATTSPLLEGVLLVVAGVYQLTPLKAACLAHCRSPLGFLMTEWREGARGALRMGFGHGLYCLGCCACLMGLLFVAGVMNLLWVAVIAAFVLVEKVAPGGPRAGRLLSWALIGAGLVVLARALSGP